jgi:hypothetical protein
MSRLQELAKIVQCPVGWIDGVVIRNVVTIILQRRWIEWEYPDRGYPQVFQVIQFTEETLKIPNSVVIGVTKGLEVELINDGFFKPNRASWFGDFLCLNGWDLHR